MADELILIIEDNEKTLKLARDILQHKGYRTREAGNAEEGGVWAADKLPAVILMDVQLPGMDGVTALSHLRADPRTASIPVVALTAFAMKADRQRFLEAGFDGYIEKPINVREFADQVRDFAR